MTIIPFPTSDADPNELPDWLSDLPTDADSNGNPAPIHPPPPPGWWADPAPTPRLYIQIDGWVNEGGSADYIVNPNGERLSTTAGLSYEAWRGGYGLRVHIDPTTSRADAISLLQQVIEAISDDRVWNDLETWIADKSAAPGERDDNE